MGIGKNFFRSRPPAHEKIFSIKAGAADAGWDRVLCWAPNIVGGSGGGAPYKFVAKGGGDR